MDTPGSRGAFVGDDELDELEAIVQEELPSYLEDLGTLVNIDCGSYTKAGVDRAGAWTARFLERLGAAIERYPNDQLGDTVVARFAGPKGAPRVLLIGHLDTVFPEGTTRERPFRIADGRATGPGVTDMKSGLLTGLYAVLALLALEAGAAEDAEDGGEGGPEISGDEKTREGEGGGEGATSEGAREGARLVGLLPFEMLTIVANPDEEIGSPVSTPVISRLALESDVCLVLEAARETGDIVSSRKGQVDLRIIVHGRAAHAGVEPERGRSAILAAAHLVPALHALADPVRGITCNVGVIAGGTRPNVVAETATLEVDLRAVTRADLVAAESTIRALCAAPAVPDVTVDVQEVSRHWPMEPSDRGARLADHAKGLGSRLGFTIHDVGTGGASDANTTAGLGIPTLDGLGPIGGNDHSEREFLEIDSIVPRTTLLAAILLAIARDPVVRNWRPHRA